MQAPRVFLLWRPAGRSHGGKGRDGDVRGQRTLLFPQWAMWLGVRAGGCAYRGRGCRKPRSLSRSRCPPARSPAPWPSSSRGAAGPGGRPQTWHIGGGTHTALWPPEGDTTAGWEDAGAHWGRARASSGVPTSPRRRYLISYLRMRPLGSDGSSQRRRTLLLLAASQATFPGMPSASPVGEGVGQLSHRHSHMSQKDSVSMTDLIRQWSHKIIMELESPQRLARP